MKVITVAEKNGEIYKRIGENEVEFPIRFEGVTTDGNLRIDNKAHFITSQLNGLKLFTREFSSEEGRILSNFVNDLDGKRDTDDILEKIDEYIEKTET